MGRFDNLISSPGNLASETLSPGPLDSGRLKGKMRVVDLFAGAGGLSCGLEMAGFEPILANEIDPQYAETYRNNHRDSGMVVGDVVYVRVS